VLRNAWTGAVGVLIFRTVLYIHVRNTEDKLVSLRCPTSLRTQFSATCVGNKHHTQTHTALCDNIHCKLNVWLHKSTLYTPT